MSLLGKKSGLRNKFLLVFFVTNLVLGIVTVNILVLCNRFLSEIGNTYSQNAQLNTYLSLLEQADTSYQDYLLSKSDVSLENYYRAANQLNSALKSFNREIVSDPVALLERDITRLTDNYLVQSSNAIQSKRARDLEMQSISLSRSKQIYQYILQYANELNQERFIINHDYYQAANERILQLQRICVVVFVLVFAANSVYFVRFMRRMTEPLVQLAEISALVSQGKYDITVPHFDSQDEVATLSEVFDNMLTSIRENLRQIERKNIREIEYRKNEFEMQNYLQEARMKNLQEQVKPHFLFNCLNTGAQLAMMEGADRACRFIQDLADFYRYNLRIGEQDTVLRNEVESVRIYVEIMRSRFGNSFDFHEDIDPRLLDIRIPILTLQPIVENAFNHGIRDIESGGEIALQISREQERIHICIVDNGPGLSPDILERVNHLEKHASNGDHDGIGVYNVARRIAIYYKGKGQFHMENRKGGSGAVISIWIPLKVEEAVNE